MATSLAQARTSQQAGIVHIPHWIPDFVNKFRNFSPDLKTQGALLE